MKRFVIPLLCVLALLMTCFAYTPETQACDRFQQIVVPQQQFFSSYGAQQVIVPQRVVVQPFAFSHGVQQVVVPQAIRQRVVVRRQGLVQRLLTPRTVVRQQIVVPRRQVQLIQIH